jgi:hypothetical protein
MFHYHFAVTVAVILLKINFKILPVDRAIVADLDRTPHQLNDVAKILELATLVIYMAMLGSI